VHEMRTGMPYRSEYVRIREETTAAATAAAEEAAAAATQGAAAALPQPCGAEGCLSSTKVVGGCSGAEGQRSRHGLRGPCRQRERRGRV
jgi:hypothetical protein